MINITGEIKKTLVGSMSAGMIMLSSFSIPGWGDVRERSTSLLDRFRTFREERVDPAVCRSLYTRTDNVLNNSDEYFLRYAERRLALDRNILELRRDGNDTRELETRVGELDVLVRQLRVDTDALTEVWNIEKHGIDCDNSERNSEAIQRLQPYSQRVDESSGQVASKLGEVMAIGWRDYAYPGIRSGFYSAVIALADFGVTMTNWIGMRVLS